MAALKLPEELRSEVTNRRQDLNKVVNSFKEAGIIEELHLTMRHVNENSQDSGRSV